MFEWTPERIDEDFPDNRGPGRPPKYTLHKLAPGESMFFPQTTTRNVGKATPRFRPLRFKCRTVLSGGVIGVKVTRIA